MIAIVASVLAIAIVCLTFVYASTPRLPEWEKEKVKEAYFEEWLGSNEKYYDQLPFIWYDENAYKEDDFVWRYVGTYGDCYAFLWIGDHFVHPLSEQCELHKAPFPLAGLSRTVYYPAVGSVVLYHTKKEITYEEYGHEITKRLSTLAMLNNREEWISDWQLERLTQDIEKLAKSHD